MQRHPENENKIKLETDEREKKLDHEKPCSEYQDDTA
jgi:hypothetical protein